MQEKFLVMASNGRKTMDNEEDAVAYAKIQAHNTGVEAGVWKLVGIAKREIPPVIYTKI